MGKILNREQIQALIKEYDIKDVNDIHNALKDLFKDTIQGILEGELDSELGYSKHDYRNKDTNNSRNGHSKKKVKSTVGEFDIAVPRDRQGEFEPQVVKKHKNDVSSIEDRILSMYARGMSTRDIHAHMEEIYGINVSAEMVSRITDKILPIVREWQNRPLEEVYTILYLDGVHFNVRQDGQVVKKVAYVAMGYNIEGIKDILGIWIGEGESSRFWLNVMNELKNRGVRDILIASVDGLSGFSEAIEAVFPETEVQRCIVHQIRNCTRFVPYKNRKEFCRDMKEIYNAPSEEAGLEALDRFEEKWGKRYPYAVSSWRRNWSELATFFKYPAEIRKMIYTTNPIESYNSAVKRLTKGKGAFTSEEALLKVLYLATMKVTKKWTQKPWNWGAVMSQLVIYFGERITRYL
jgi:transposase-like protein